MEKFCTECGTELIKKETPLEGIVPFCPSCGQFRFPKFNVAVSMIVTNKANGKILLIKQYGRDWNVLVAGYVNLGENAESSVVREVKEETGMTVTSYRFNRTKYFEPSNTLMCNFTAFVDDDSEFAPNEEIDASAWYTPEEARANILPDSLAEFFLVSYLDEVGL